MKTNKEIVGYTAGVFDVFHIGHLNIIKEAKKKCDYLIVACTTDELSLKQKNKNPVIPYNERVEILESLKYVDKVVPQENYNKLDAWHLYKFDYIFVGSDWQNTKLWINYELEFEKLGAKVVYIPYTKHISSTKIKTKIDQ